MGKKICAQQGQIGFSMKVYLQVIFISVAGWLEEFSLSSDAIISCSIYPDKYTVKSPKIILGVVPLWC